MSRNKQLTLFALSLIFILSACSPAADEAAIPEPAAVDLTPVVSATGEVVPEQEALLSISAGGVIEDVLVKKGDTVKAGQVLVLLEGTEQQLAAVSAAELELLNEQFALEALSKDTDLWAAQALQSVEAAERTLEDLNNPELQQALALQAVTNAQKAVDHAERNLEILIKPPAQNVIDQAYANMLLAEKKLNATLEQIEDTEWQFKKYSASSKLPANIKKEILTSLRQALKGLEIKRTQDQITYNDSQTKYRNLLAPPDPVDVDVAESELAAALALLLEAEKEWERVLDGPKSGEVALLEAQIDNGYRDFEIYSAGSDPDDVALAEARISNAEAQLAAAKATITDLELVAPFDGVISAVHINPSEWVAPGTPVLLIADLSHLQVETTDLSEIDVAQISVGDTAIVTLDALPELVLEGTVISIAPKAAAGAGVNYPVIIELSEIPAALRWGMTAFVDIELDK